MFKSVFTSSHTSHKALHFKRDVVSLAERDEVHCDPAVTPVVTPVAARGDRGHDPWLWMTPDGLNVNVQPHALRRSAGRLLYVDERHYRISFHFSGHTFNFLKMIIMTD